MGAVAVGVTGCTTGSFRVTVRGMWPEIKNTIADRLLLQEADYARGIDFNLQKYPEKALKNSHYGK